ncbi:hypothetical protein RUM44_007974 [Polyplax serrata]|uniref:Uncharacterized protein n=1 Tax=Polyplax serrata TaxID=468196 RepID=A0ABR1BAZ7_POLSC
MYQRVRAVVPTVRSCLRGSTQPRRNFWQGRGSHGVHEAGFFGGPERFQNPWQGRGMFGMDRSFTEAMMGRQMGRSPGDFFHKNPWGPQGVNRHRFFGGMERPMDNVERNYFGGQWGRPHGVSGNGFDRMEGPMGNRNFPGTNSWHGGEPNAMNNQWGFGRMERPFDYSRGNSFGDPSMSRFGGAEGPFGNPRGNYHGNSFQGARPF